MNKKQKNMPRVPMLETSSGAAVQLDGSSASDASWRPEASAGSATSGRGDGDFSAPADAATESAAESRQVREEAAREREANLAYEAELLREGNRKEKHGRGRGRVRAGPGKDKGRDRDKV